MIEMMEDYTNELEDRLKRKDEVNVKLIPDDIALNLHEPAHNPSYSGFANFSNRRMAVMTMCVYSATALSGSNWSLVEVVKEAAMSVVGEVFVVEEAWNLIIVAIGSDVPHQSTGTPVAQLLMLAGQVINKVGPTYRHRTQPETILASLHSGIRRAGGNLPSLSLPSLLSPSLSLLPFP